MTDTALVPSSNGALSTTQMLEGLRTVRDTLAPDLSPQELQLFAMVATRSGLDPFAKQIYAVKRKGRVTFQTGIDGYRSIAARTGMYDGQDEPEYGPACACGDNRPAGHPEYATVRVYRKGVERAIAATAYWHEYKPEAGQSGMGDTMWVRMPRVMIAKVAEALALRKAFPYDPERKHGIGADIYTADEMTQADRPPIEARPDLRSRLAARVEAIDPTTQEASSEASVETQEAKDGDLGAAVDAEYDEDLAGDAAPSSSTEAAASTPASNHCGNASPYGDGAECGLLPGHKGLHRQLDVAGLVVGSWPTT